MDCYTCQQEAVSRCPRCGNPFCADHGDPSASSGQAPSASSGQRLCADCLDPVSAAPSGVFFRGSLLALLLGSVLALWLLIRPPGLPGESSEVAVPDSTPSPSPQPVTPAPAETPELPVLGPTEEPTATPTPAPTDTPTPKPTATPKPKPTPTPEPTATPTPEGPTVYIVQQGDNIYGIAQFFGVNYLDLLAVNGLTEEEAQFLQPGNQLVIPQ